MSDEKKTVAFEGAVDAVQVQTYLKDLMAGFKAGSIWVQNGGDVVGLTPDAMVSMGFEARRKGARQSLKIHFEWELNETADDASAALTISAKEPESIVVEESE
ncbi:MAG: amphi-Trp domain-containing protein [Longimicrobiales bacterium]